MAERKKKGSFDYWPQSILLFLGLATVCIGVFALFRAAPEVRDLPKDATLTMTTLLNYQEKDLPVSDLLVSDKNLVVFWATWCGPCVDEIKDMPKLLPQIREKGYAPIFINYDSPENKVIADNFAKQHGISSAFDLRGELLFNLGLSSLPVSLIVDKTGKILKTLPGELRLSRL